MNKVIITSTNPAKIAAVESAFETVFPGLVFDFEGVYADSQVPDQPMSSDETLQGALNRIRYTKKQYQADYFVSIEAGLDDIFTFAWMVIESQGRVGKSRSASVPLPPKALELLASENELGDVMDMMFKTQNIKQKGGAIGLLTHDKLTRSSVYHQALILALIPFVNPDLFPAKPCL